MYLPERVFPPLEVIDTAGYYYQPLYKDKSFLHQKYVVEGLSIAQIATQIVSAKETVRGRLKRFGITLRDPHRCHGRSPQPRFGKKQSGDHQIDNVRELRAVEAIKEMKSSGMSLRQMCKVLSLTGVPTKCLGQRWHPEMVRRILETGP